MPIKVFIAGATGYQGSTLLKALRADEGKYEIVGLARSEKSAAALREQGVQPVIASFSDTKVLRKCAEGADVVFSLASADDLEPVKAFVEGLRSKGKQGVLIHTSGTSVLADDSKSAYASDVIYSDANAEQVHALPDTQMHKNVDDWILASAKDITAIIVCPPLIYGEAGNPGRQSVQIPMLAQAMVKAKCAATVGRGEAMWNCVHVQDLARLYVALLEACLNPDTRAQAEGWYFVESGEFAWKDLSTAIAGALVQEGRLTETDADSMREFTSEELKQHLLGDPLTYSVLGCNARCKAERGRALGWSPTMPNLFETVAEDVRRALAAEGGSMTTSTFGR